MMTLQHLFDVKELSRHITNKKRGLSRPRFYYHSEFVYFTIFSDFVEPSV